MKKQQFTASIQAPRVIVWEVLWNDKTYRQWTSAFTEGSYAESDWEEGSEIKFLSPGGSGMYAVIEKKTEPEYMAFKHVGEIKSGKKMPPGEWSGAMETYRLTEKDGVTDLLVEMEANGDFLEFLNAAWPKALSVLKQLAESEEMKSVTIEATVKAPIEKVWATWNDPKHVIQWNTASPDWHTPRAENDLRKGGKFLYRMEAKDGSFGFDFGGDYTDVKNHALIAYTMGDGRKVKTEFSSANGPTKVVVKFEVESMNSVAMQRFGWQSILDNFKKYCETHS